MQSEMQRRSTTEKCKAKASTLFKGIWEFESNACCEHISNVFTEISLLIDDIARFKFRHLHHRAHLPKL